MRARRAALILMKISILIGQHGAASYFEFPAEEVILIRSPFFPLFLQAPHTDRRALRPFSSAKEQSEPPAKRQRNDFEVFCCSEFFGHVQYTSLKKFGHFQATQYPRTQSIKQANIWFGKYLVDVQVEEVMFSQRLYPNLGIVVLKTSKTTYNNGLPQL